jgi:GTPase-associated protein 1, N-terminal domain type 1
MVDVLKVPNPITGVDVLHQLLHGYSDGHRLLQNSFTVPDDLARLLLGMSDLSGSNMTNGFEEYITGYPLPSLDAYALGKTWYAPEMPRPGCVWTHTIVIPASAMAQIPALDTLESLFKRPGDVRAGNAYSKPIPLATVRHEKSRVGTTVGRGEMPALLFCHYGDGGKPVLCAAQTSRQFEDLIFAVWSQKWPHLRMSFTFCTGSLSARNYGKRPFDIQCVPTSLTREVMREIGATSVAQPILLNSITVDSPTWAISAAADAWSPEGRAIRKFLWSVADARSEREDFVSFITILDALTQSLPPSGLISLIAARFPEPSAGEGLKRRLLGDQLGDDLPSYEERDVLFAISTTRDYQSFGTQADTVRKRATALCVERPQSARDLIGELFRSPVNVLGEKVLAGLISAMDSEMALQVTSQQPHLLPALFRAEPSLASSSQLWLAGSERKRELFEAIAGHADLDSSVVAGVIKALLDSGLDGLIRRAIQRWGRDATFQVLDWTDVHKGAMSDTCREALTFDLSWVMDWVEAEPARSSESLVAVAHVIAPYSSDVVQRDSTVWLRAFRTIKDSCKETDKVYVGTFLLALALRNAPPSPLDLVSESFECVHEAAEKQRLSDSAWIIIEPLVPELSWFSNWDKCERLRRGLLLAFVRHGWPASELKRRIKDFDVLRLLLRSARKVDGAEQLFRDLHVSD